MHLISSVFSEFKCPTSFQTPFQRYQASSPPEYLSVLCRLYSWQRWGVHTQHAGRNTILFKINLNWQNPVKPAAFLFSVDLIMKLFSVILLLVYASILVKSDCFGGGMPAGTGSMCACTGVRTVAQSTERTHQHLILLCLPPAGWRTACHKYRRRLQFWKT